MWSGLNPPTITKINHVDTGPRLTAGGCPSSLVSEFTSARSPGSRLLCQLAIPIPPPHQNLDVVTIELSPVSNVVGHYVFLP